jgi:four helix bundle protein
LVISDTSPNAEVERRLPLLARVSQQSEELKERSMSFAVNILQLIDTFPRKPAADVIARQLAKSATSVAANYRSACTARSGPDFVSKLCIVVEESEESLYWIEMILRTRIVASEDVSGLRQEAIELRAIFSRSLRTARANSRTLPGMTR